MDHVYDVKKDLINKSDFKESKKVNNNKSNKDFKRKILLWVTYILAFLVVALFISDQ